MKGDPARLWVLGAWGAILLLAGWVRWLHPAFLGASAVGLVLSLRSGPVRQGAGALAFATLVLAVVAGFVGDRELRSVAADWERVRETREEAVQTALGDALDGVIRDGDHALDLLTDALALPTTDLASVRRATGMDAAAVFDREGNLVAWDGEHHGRIPVEVRQGEPRYLYAERPLFGYLYFTAPRSLEEGSVMVARLLRAEFPPTLNGSSGDFASRFERRTGAVLHISRAERVAGESVWDLRWEDEALFSVALAPLGQAEVREALTGRWGGLVAGLLLLGWLLLARAVAFKGGWRPPAALSLLAVVLVLPVGALLGLPGLFSPVDFLLPGPLDVTLGRLLVLGAVGAVLVGFLDPPRPGVRAALLGVVGTTGAFAAVLWLFRNGAAPILLAGTDWEWTGYAATLGLFLSLIAAVGLRPARRNEGDRTSILVASAGATALLSLLLVLQVRSGPEVPIWAVLVWTVPLGLACAGLGAPDGRMRRAAVRWLLAVVLGVALALPYAFGDRVAARLAVAEGEVERLGTRVDPYLEFLLHRMSEEADSLRAHGRSPVEVLYGAWVGSGIAWEGVPIWLTHWSSEGVPIEELRVGVSETRPTVPVELVEEAFERESVVVRRFDLADAHYMAVVPLPEGERVTAVLPPRRALAPATPVGPKPERPGRETLVLIPLLPGEVPGETGQVRWMPTEEGWQSELYLAYPDEVYHAHYIVQVPGTLLLVARGTLLTLLLLVGTAVLWIAGRWIAGRASVAERRWRKLGSSFQARVTLALFAFFLAPTLVFGTMAYRTLHGASVRTAEVLAERAVEDAAGWLLELDRDMEALSRRVGSDLLLYDRGELVEGSLPALAELGLYQGWLPQRIHRIMDEGEELLTTAPFSLGEWDYVMAYRRVAGSQVLAAPAAVEVGATALRQREITELLGFALVLGAGLSVLLALVVGRALSRPIQTLQVASERVGAGNLGVHLPADRTDEFGAVFAAFNRMVRRLRAARKALVRSTRRARAIVEEVATGLVALDAEGWIVLANPKAEELLGIELPSGSALPAAEEGFAADDFLRWLEHYFGKPIDEESTELQIGTRRIRVRARRISRRGPPRGGVVVSLEDVTDELRSERILAWGEMARQVAHEVKNPLTPIKLSVQHIRRAWRDRRPDYGEILERNARAILREIDRLATVASGFSRFAAPGETAGRPLEAVDVDEVVSEVLTLYAAGEGRIDFGFTASEGLAPVRARAAELKEVLVNLLENSRAAVGEGGRVHVRVTGSNGRVEVAVQDDGGGIPPGALPHVFEPHFSTRSSGTGLGLAIVQRLVQSWGGTVELESVEDVGTTVRLRLVPWEPTRPAGPAGGGPGGDGENP